MKTLQTTQKVTITTYKFSTIEKNEFEYKSEFACYNISLTSSLSLNCLLKEALIFRGNEAIVRTKCVIAHLA